jgi:hypothetical protein
MVYVLWAGFARRTDRRVAIAAGVVAGESLIFAANGFRCPLTEVAQRVGAEHGAVTDIYLPRWFAHNLPTIHVALTNHARQTPPQTKPATGLTTRTTGVDCRPPPARCTHRQLAETCFRSTAGSARLSYQGRALRGTEDARRGRTQQMRIPPSASVRRSTSPQHKPVSPAAAAPAATSSRKYPVRNRFALTRAIRTRLSGRAPDAHDARRLRARLSPSAIERDRTVQPHEKWRRDGFDRSSVDNMFVVPCDAGERHRPLATSDRPASTCGW